MKFFKKTIRFLDRIIDFSILIVSLCLFLIGLYALIDSYLLYQNANDTDILKFKPGYENKSSDDKEIQGNMVAWVTVNGTTIDYPVMQGIDNIEYLNKDPFGDYSLTGSIFLDARNSSDFSDRYSLIYGHHMEQGAMFGALDDFLKEEFYGSHRNGTLIVGDKTYQIDFFAVVEVDANEDAIFAPTENDKTLPFLEEKALYLDKGMMEEAKTTNYLALSTCKYPDTSERTVVFGLLKEGSD